MKTKERRRTRRQQKIQGLRKLVANMGEESSLVTRRTTHHCLPLLHPQCYRQFSLAVWLRDVSSACPPAGQKRQTEWSWHSSRCPLRGFVRFLTVFERAMKNFYSKKSLKDSHFKCAWPSVIKLLCCGTTYYSIRPGFRLLKLCPGRSLDTELSERGGAGGGALTHLSP